MFQPVLPMSGYAGWRFLERTLDVQQETFARAPSVSKITDQFRADISKVKTADDLVENRALLSVALGAFGLDDDIGNKFFIGKILSDGTTSDTALANRLADKSYAAMSAAFGFGDPGGPFTNLTGFADRIIAKFEAKQFQRAVGDQDNDLRLALSIKEGLNDIADQSERPATQWFSLMGNPPLRAVFETALGLPSSLAKIDLDQQLRAFQTRSESVFGTNRLSDFKNKTEQENLIQMFLIRSQVNAASSRSSGSIALSLLQN